MGKTYSKEEVVIAQNSAVETQVNQFNITLIVIASLLVIVLVTTVWLQCRRKVKKWLRKEVSIAATKTNTSPPADSYA